MLEDRRAQTCGRKHVCEVYAESAEGRASSPHVLITQLSSGKTNRTAKRNRLQADEWLGTLPLP